MLRELAHLGGFSKMIETILLDDDKERTPIRLKLKAIKFIAYVWKENNSTSSNENTSADILTSEELKKVCGFFLSDDRLYLERKYPFSEDDSLVWIEQVSEVIKTFSVHCVPSWEDSNNNLNMVKWVEDAENFLQSQFQKHEDQDIKENIQDIYNNILEVLNFRKHFLESVKKTKEEL